MRRTVLWPLAFGLAVLTVVALLSVDYATTDGVAPPVPSRANAAAVWRFYDAANVTIRTGDSAELERLLAPGFVDHAAGTGLPPTAVGVVRYLLGLRAAYPELRLAPEDVIAQGNRVAARVRVEGTDGGAFLGVPLGDGLAPWGTLDLFRVEGGRIAEHWGGGAPVVPELLLRAPLAGEVARSFGVEAPVTVAVQARSLGIEPGTNSAVPVGGDALVHVEAGSLVARAAAPIDVLHAAESVAGSQRESVATDQDWVLRSGDAAFVPAGTVVGLHNAGDGPAVALLVTIDSRIFPDVAPPTPPPYVPAPTGSPSVATEVTVDVGRVVQLPAGPMEVVVGRLTLAPGASLATGAVPLVALAVVQRGTLATVVDGRAVELHAGAGTVLPLGEPAVLRNAGRGSLALLLVAVGPLEAGGTPVLPG